MPVEAGDGQSETGDIRFRCLGVDALAWSLEVGDSAEGKLRTAEMGVSTHVVWLPGETKAQLSPIIFSAENIILPSRAVV